jgi:hypothetical protein
MFSGGSLAKTDGFGSVAILGLCIFILPLGIWLEGFALGYLT